MWRFWSRSRPDVGRRRVHLPAAFLAAATAEGEAVPVTPLALAAATSTILRDRRNVGQNGPKQLFGFRRPDIVAGLLRHMSSLPRVGKIMVTSTDRPPSGTSQQWNSDREDEHEHNLGDRSLAPRLAQGLPHSPRGLASFRHINIGTIARSQSGLEDGSRQMADGQPLRLGESNNETKPTTIRRGAPPFTTFDLGADTTEALVVRTSGAGLLVESSGNGLNVRAENGPVGVDVVMRRGTAMAASTEDPEKSALVATVPSGGRAIVAFGRCEFFGRGFATLRARHEGQGFAGFFDGAVGVDGDLNVNRDIAVLGDVKLVGADLAEEFDLLDDRDVDPGSVVVLAGGDGVRLSDEPYDHRVAGVVSGAGDFRPGVVLGRRSGSARRPLALSGKVWCKVDADCASIDVGDLLTTSSTPGHAMKASDPARSFGSILGKSLASLPSGRGLVPVLVTLH